MLHKLLADMPFFVEVAKRKSFTKAADALDIPLATLSRRIAVMEKDLGIQLLHRTTRNVELTENGQRFFEQCEHIVAQAENAREQLFHDQEDASGRVRICFPESIYFAHLQGVFSAFVEKYPAIEMHLFISSRWVDLYSEPFDLEIRVGNAMPDSSLKMHKLATLYPGIYASPRLLEQYPAPETPGDLAALPYIHPAPLGRYELELCKGDEVETIAFQPVHVVNSLALGRELILAGKGFSLVAMAEGRTLEGKNELIRLLPEWHGPGINISLVMTGDKQPQRVRLLVDHLVEHFRKLPA